MAHHPTSLLIATTNAGKAREFAEMIRDSALPVSTSNVLSLADLGALAEIPETGDTFAANAALKASGYALATGYWTVADDSGLAVDALGGKPGVYSARWAEMHHAGAGDAANNALLLTQMQTYPVGQRSARFVCALALANPLGHVVLTAGGVMAGTLGFFAAGSNGFGYDPLFEVDGMGDTSAQLCATRKHAISHRGNALRRLSTVWKRSGLTLLSPGNASGPAGTCEVAE